MLTDKFTVDDIIEKIISFCERIGLVEKYASFSFFTYYRNESMNKVIDYYRCLVKRFGDISDRKYFEFIVERIEG